MVEFYTREELEEELESIQQTYEEVAYEKDEFQEELESRKADIISDFPDYFEDVPVESWMCIVESLDSNQDSETYEEYFEDIEQDVESYFKLQEEIEECEDKLEELDRQSDNIESILEYMDLEEVSVVQKDINISDIYAFKSERAKYIKDNNLLDLSEKRG